MKPHDPNPLLKEILLGDELTDFRQASLEKGLYAIRRHQRHRRGMRLGALLMLPLILTLAILSRPAPEHSNRPITSINPTPATLLTPPTDNRDTKSITDEELFALFPNRPLALVGKPGQQQLVFLDATAKGRHP